MATDGLDTIERLSRIRLIAIDIDGTLLEDPNAEVAEVLATLNASLGHHLRRVTLTIATGRAFEGAQKVIQRLKLSRTTPVILYNGAVICDVDGGRLNCLHLLQMDEIYQVVTRVLEIGLSALVYQPKPYFSLRADDSDPEPAISEHVTGYSSVPGPASEFNGLPVEWRTSASVLPKDAAAIIVPTPFEGSNSLVSDLEKLCGATVTKSSNAYLEIRPRAVNKGNALSVVASGRSLTPEDVLAIGDNDNDIEMLDWAGCSVAVANSTSGAIQASDFVTEGTAGQGVVETLRLIYDARRHQISRK
jgi:Cof subfamily protein (haloacid dehalogenase superfamily)